jgi:hypothetical protein
VANVDSDLFFVISLNSKKRKEKPCFLKASVTLARSFVGHSINFAFVATDVSAWACRTEYPLRSRSRALRGHVANLFVPRFMAFLSAE